MVQRPKFSRQQYGVRKALIGLTSNKAVGL